MGEIEARDILTGICWDQRLGLNPSQKLAWPLYAGLVNNAIQSKASLEWSEPCGHNVVRDAEFSAGSQLESTVAVSPLFVRDLAGRIIHIGFGPMYKEREEWRNAPPRTFPRFSRPIGQEEARHLEKIFLTCFRILDMSLSKDARRSGQPRGVYGHVAYQNANLYPYKLRLDTFYQDGWRIPQTEYLYTVSENVNLKDSEALVAAALKKWDERPAGQSYEQFYEGQNGDEWFEELFWQGVTVIPTFEAHNGFNKVSSDFALQDFWPGRAVSDLHKIIEERPSDAPKGTILDVIRPGFALARRIEQAHVVVSDGSGYRSPHAHDPEPLLPDLRLPHTRCVTEWGACWLPTHPKHFEAPSLWGWDDDLGYFTQLSGPLWDPLHYYYKSVDEVVKAFKSPLADDPKLVPVPEHMKLAFYPVTVMDGFDVSSSEVFFARRKSGIRIESGIRRVPQEQPSSTLGYHPLPMELEYELDNWWFPELAPKYRLKNPRPARELAQRIAPVIKSHIAPADYLVHVEDEAWWIKNPEGVKIASGRPLEDYPLLNRYLGEMEIVEAAKHFVLHLEHVESSVLTSSPYQLWPDDKADVLDKIVPGFYAALMTAREYGLKLLRFRHDLYQNDIDAYYLGFWMILPPDVVAQILIDGNVKQIAPDNRAEEMSKYLSEESDAKKSKLSGYIGGTVEEIRE